MIVGGFHGEPGETRAVIRAQPGSVAVPDIGADMVVIAAGGHERGAAAAAGPAGTTATLIAAGLRGRGGGGFLTGTKWQATAAEPADQHYAVANGYESDPAVFANRLLMEENPQAVVEGLAIAAVAIFIPKKSLDLREVVALGVTAAVVFAVLDLVSPSIAFTARQGEGPITLSANPGNGRGCRLV